MQQTSKRYDGAGKNGFFGPVLRYLEEVLFGQPRVQWKITGNMCHWRGGVERSRGYIISPPWVQSGANLQITMLMYVILPGVVADYNDRGIVVPQTLCLRHDGGGDVGNKTHMSACYWLAQAKCFSVVRDDRCMKGHSHDDYDWAFMVLLRWLKRRPGCGGMTPELLKQQISEMSDCNVFVLDRAYDFKAYFAACPFKELKHAREPLGKRYALQSDGSVTVSVCPDPTAPQAVWTVIGEGETGGDRPFFQAPPPPAAPALAAPWSNDVDAAATAEGLFARAISNIQTKAAALSASVLSRYKVPGESVDAKRAHVVGAWDEMLRQRPPAGGQMGEPQLELIWPPPFVQALEENRQRYGGIAALPEPAPVAVDDDAIAGQRPRARTTSRLPEVQGRIESLNQAESVIDQPGPVQLGAFHFVVDEHGGGLIWVGRVESINARQRSTPDAARTPGMLPAWSRPAHHAKCAAKGGVYTTADTACTVNTCPRPISCDIRWYAPADVGLTGVGSCVETALAFGGGGSAFVAPFLSSHFETRSGCPKSEVAMGYIGPVVEIHQSSSATKVKLKAESKRVYATIAAQLAKANHPGFSL